MIFISFCFGVWLCLVKLGDLWFLVGISIGVIIVFVFCFFLIDKLGIYGRYKGFWCCFLLFLLSSERKLFKNFEDRSVFIVME